MTKYLTAADGPLALQVSPYIYQNCDALALVNDDGVDNQVRDQVAKLKSLQLTDEAQDALKQASQVWQTPEGQQLKADLPNLSTPQVLARFQSLIRDCLDLIDPIMALNDKPIFKTPSLEGVYSAFEAGIGSVVFTGGISIDLLGGVSVGIGYAFNPKDTNSSCLFVTGSGLAGVEEEVEIGGQVGICAATPDALGGFSVGVTGTADLGVGVALTVTAGFEPSLIKPHITNIDLSNWSVFIEGAAGEGFGLSTIIGASLVVLTDATPPIAQTDAPYMFRIKDANCIKAMDSVGKDEVYVEFQVDGVGTTYRWPTWSHVSVPEGGTADFLRTVKVNTRLVATLKQGSDKIIGSCTCTVGDANFPQPGSCHSFHFEKTTELINKTEYNFTIERIV